MARKYKANRLRGSRKSSYATKFLLGYTIPKRKDFKNDEAYLEEFIRLNRENLEASFDRDMKAAYKSGGEATLMRFQQSTPTVKSYVKKFFTDKEPNGKVKIRFTQKELKNVIKLKFASMSQKQSQHLADLMSSNEDFMEELVMRIQEDDPDEKFDYQRLVYTGDNTYRYTKKNGKTIKFRFRSYSPAIMEFFE